MKPKIVIDPHNRIRLVLAFAGYVVEPRLVGRRGCALVIRAGEGQS